MKNSIVPFDSEPHRKDVVQLWKSVFGYESDHNDPELAIDKKLAMDDGLFLVAVGAAEVVGSIMAGYDGHRGWLYALAISPDWRKRGIGSDLIASAEAALIALGCMKINLQISQGNEGVEAYSRLLIRVNDWQFLTAPADDAKTKDSQPKGGAKKADKPSRATAAA